MNAIRKLTFVILMIFATQAMAISVRIKDIVSIDGIYEAKLVGMGLVTGLNQTGDRPNEVTQRFLENMMQEMGVSLALERSQAKNIAVVTVTANLPPFAKVGSQIDVQIDSFQSATSLQGGTLLPTPLFHSLDPKKEVFIMASGVISIGGFGASADGEKVQKNHLTAGNIPSGGVVHKPMRIEVFENEELTLVPYHADYTTATRIVSIINQNFDPATATAIDSGSILLRVPTEYKTDDAVKYTDNVVRFVSEIGDLKVEIDRPATVVIDERTGTIVIGSQVTISTVAVTHGSLTITVGIEKEVSQPSAMSEGETVIVEEPTVQIEESEAMLIQVPDSTTISEVVSALNALGATPRELISILQNIDRAGALHAKLVIR